MSLPEFSTDLIGTLPDLANRMSYLVFPTELIGTLSLFGHWGVCVLLIYLSQYFHQTSWYTAIIWSLGIRCLTQFFFHQTS